MTKPLPPPLNDPPRQPGLTLFGQIDLCRGLFAMLVVLCHGFTGAWGMHRDAPATLSPTAYAWLLDSVGAGFYWVMGFFVLSGYCIHQSVARQIDAGRFALGPYLAARATRILPLYYLALLFAVAAAAITSTLLDGESHALDDRTVLFAQLAVVQNLVRCYPGFVASWSITNELAYYLLYGLLAWLAMGRRAFPAWVGLATCVLIGGVLQLVYLAGYQDAWVLRTGLLFGLGVNWFLGVLVAVERDRIRGSVVFQAVARTWPIVLVATIVGHHWGLPIQVSYLISGAAFALMLIRMTASERSAIQVDQPGWITSVLSFLGLMSYPTYLFHAPWQALLIVLLPWAGWDADWRITWAVLTLSSLILGGVIGWGVERPIMRWRGRFLARLRSGPTWSPAPAEAVGLAHLRRTTGS